MKKKLGFFKTLGKKNTILAVVALVLVLMTVIGTSYSWIEEVSQVEFSSTNGQETPLRIGSKVLKAEAVMKQSPTTDEINLADYFYESGGMHLSPCYSDGDRFIFPVQKRSTGSLTYRIGTKDDANVNYLSATFKVKSDNANTAYWFEKVNSSTNFITCKKADGTAIDLSSYLRVSVTVDGVTNVYAYNSNGTFTGVNAAGTLSASSQQGRRLASYMYYTEAFNNSSPVGYYKNSANVTNKPNQGSGSNLNGNTLFTVNKYDEENKKNSKDVTVKIWLQYNNSGVRDVRVSNVNLKLTSSWAKTRRVYVRDKTVHQEGYDSAKWLGTYSSTLWWGIRDELGNVNKRWQLTRVSSTSDYYYADIPAVYNNTDVVLFRNSSAGWNGGNTTSYTYNNVTVNCWNKWVTKFPDTFHSEVFTVYSTDFGTWNEDDVNSIYIVNSLVDRADMYDYMWDSSTEHGSGINDKVVRNADWPGVKMTTELKTKTNSQSLKTYAFFYNADYDRIIFNDGDVVSGFNQEYQTQDLWLTDSEKNCTFDMTTLTWFHTNPTRSDWTTKMPNYSANNTYLYSNISTNNQWKKTRFAYGGEYSSTSGNAFNGTSSSKMLCKIYNKAGTTSTLSDYKCKLVYDGNWYGAYNNSDHRLYPGHSYTLGSDSNHQDDLILEDLKGKTVYRLYFEWDNGNPKLSLAEGEALT